jgi:hypothetical protein
MTATEVVQRQLDAYNRRDLDAFVATYSDDVVVFRMPAPEPALTGKAQLAEFYRTKRFNEPKLRAELLQRIATGNKVIDHERITGLGNDPVEAVAVYEVDGAVIRRVWFFYPA